MKKKKKKNCASSEQNEKKIEKSDFVFSSHDSMQHIMIDID